MFVDVFAKSSPMKLEDFQNFVGFSEYNNLKKKPSSAKGPFMIT